MVQLAGDSASAGVVERPSQDRGQLAPSRSPGGVGLILVMLALLVMSVLAAAVVFTARSETFASYNYKLNTEADYLAKAGIQHAVNWFRSARYRGAPATEVATYYNVASDGSIYNLYTANSEPVQCLSSCSNANSAVQLIGYGGGSSNYPGINNAAGIPVASAFENDLVSVRLTGDAYNSGTFSVNAVLLNYATANVGTPPNLTSTPVETWLVTSQGTWTAGSGSAFTVATAEEQAIIQPNYSPTWGFAVYGFCSATMGGSAGSCTDSYNSALGPYGGGNPSVLAGGCDSNSTNVIAAGAGVGANGGVTLSSNVTVSGNVTIGVNPSTGCAASGFNGNAGSVLGQVVNGPHVNAPPVPAFPPGFPGDAPSYNSQVLPVGAAWPPASAFNNFPSATGQTPPLAYSGPCMSGLTCNGSASSPYLINSITPSGSQKIQLIGGPDPKHPVFYDIAGLSETGNAEVDVSGYVVLNVQNSLSIAGNGVTNSATTDIPPECVEIGYGGTSAVSVGGNGAVSALITAPLANVTLGGGGSKGYMTGSIEANNVSVQGGYPIHYDMQLNRLGGAIGVMTTASYSRKKM